MTQPVKSAALESAIPANLRGADGQWFALSLRARVLYADKSLPLTSFRYEDLANPKYKGKVCIRAGQHPYNTALVASLIAHDGEAKAEQWLRGVKANLARKATGGDRDVARDILGGICDVGLANSYYVGQMKGAKEGTDARKWGDAIKVVAPDLRQCKERRHARQHQRRRRGEERAAARQRGQAARVPGVGAGAGRSTRKPTTSTRCARAWRSTRSSASSIGELKVDPLPLTEIAKYRKQASALVDKVGFDQ